MKRYYSDEDVLRWEAAQKRSIDLHLGKLAAPDLPPQKFDFHLGMLSLSHYMQGMTHIARGRCQNAVDSFRASVEATCKTYERFERGQGPPLEAGDFQSILVAYVAGDGELISTIVNYYRGGEGTPGSIFAGGILKCLASGKLEDAKAMLLQKRPRFERQFMGYAECFEAITHIDGEGFSSAILLSSQNWAKWASRVVKGLPDAVCFVQGAGLVRLAQKVMGAPVEISNEHIPQELLH